MVAGQLPVVRPLDEAGCIPPTGEVGREQQSLEVLAGLGVPRPGPRVAGHAGGVHQPAGHPVGRVRVRRVVHRRPGRGLHARARRRERPPTPDLASARAPSTGVEVLGLGRGHDDAALPLEGVGDDETDGLARTVGPEDDRGDAVLAGEASAGCLAGSGHDPVRPSRGRSGHRDPSLVGSAGPARDVRVATASANRVRAMCAIAAIGREHRAARSAPMSQLGRRRRSRRRCSMPPIRLRPSATAADKPARAISARGGATTRSRRTSEPGCDVERRSARPADDEHDHDCGLEELVTTSRHHRAAVSSHPAVGVDEGLLVTAEDVVDDEGSAADLPEAAAHGKTGEQAGLDVGQPE